MRKKLYTAFLSSNYSGLKEERSIAIKKLLDANVFPVSMEHFVIGSTDGFRDICELIDDSDVFILLMGTRYGSRDERGDNKSWTEKEFDYALENNQKMLNTLILRVIFGPACIDGECITHYNHELYSIVKEPNAFDD